jgi:uncharacterized protein YkwD
MRTIRYHSIALSLLSIVAACAPQGPSQDAGPDGSNRVETGGADTAVAAMDTGVAPFDGSSPEDSGVAVDTGTSATDTGVSSSDTGVSMDTGVAPRDTGVAPRDTGVGTDTGVVPRDTGVMMDTGVAPRDTGVMTDTGVPPRDTGVSPADSGTGGCPAPPASASANAVLAYNLTNSTRLAMGLRCQTMVETINRAAQNHCNYYAANRGIPMCVANAHNEVMSCSMFTGVGFSDRMRAAGYTGSPSFEVMAFANNGTVATQMWIDSIWHRTPVLSPWTLDMGYGSATGCDTIDYGVGAGGSVPASTIATYPYNNQTNVPTSFSGNEGPPPPPPPTGWPSGYPVTLYFRGTLATHTLTLDGSTTDIPHVWLAPGSPMAMGLLRNEFVLYAHRPLTARTRYRVRATGTATGGAATTIDFVFTTR